MRLSGELHALQRRLLVGELVDEGLLEGQFLVLGGSGLQHGQKRRAQLLGTQTLQGLRLHHDGRDCASVAVVTPTCLQIAYKQRKRKKPHYQIDSGVFFLLAERESAKYTSNNIQVVSTSC